MTIDEIKKEYPLVYVLTLNWNTPLMTIECVKSIFRSDYTNFKIVVVDNNSSDGSYESLKKEFGNKIYIIKTDENLGYGRGMNFGLKYAVKYCPDYFFIMNSDTKLDNKAISEMVKTAQKYDNNCLVTGKVYHYDRPNVIQYVGSRFVDRKYLIYERICKVDEIDIGQYDEEVERDMIDDIFWLMPLKIYKDVGGYSPYFFMNAEQADLALRIVENGYKLIYTPNAKIWHKGSLSTGGLGNLKMIFWDTKSRMIYYFLHLTKIRFIKIYCRTLWNISISLLKNLIKPLIGRKSYLKKSYASLRGVLSFSAWLIKKTEATSYNPF